MQLHYLTKMHFLEFWWSQKYHQMNGHPQFSWKWHLKCFSTTKIKRTWILGRIDGGHLEFDLSRSSEVKSNFPPHLKLILMVCTNYAGSFMLFSKSAQFDSYSALLKPQKFNATNFTQNIFCTKISRCTVYIMYTKLITVFREIFILNLISYSVCCTKLKYTIIN